MEKKASKQNRAEQGKEEKAENVFQAKSEEESGEESEEDQNRGGRGRKIYLIGWMGLGIFRQLKKGVARCYYKWPSPKSV